MHHLTNRFSPLKECTDSEPVVVSNTQSSSPIHSGESTMPERILVRSISKPHSTELKIYLESVSSHQPMGVTALLDSGATGLFIDSDFVHAKNFTTKKLPRAVPVYNIDGTLNNDGHIRETVDLIVHYQDHTERATFFVTALGGVPVILGHPWLEQHNPVINWQTGEVVMSHCPDDCQMHHIRTQCKRCEHSKSNKGRPSGNPS